MARTYAICDKCYFVAMRAFVINLERRPDRKENMERQLERAGLADAVFVNAVDGREMDMEGMDRYQEHEATSYNGEPMLPGEVACALSHIGIYERMLAEDIERCLILEDDVMLPSGLGAVISRLGRENPDSDLITFNYHPVQVFHAPRWDLFLSRPYLLLYYLLKIPYNSFLKLYEAVLGIIYAKKPRAIWLPRPLYLAGCYLLTREGAQKLLSHTHPIHYTADKLLNRARVLGRERLIVRACVPLLVRQNQQEYGSDMEYQTRTP